MWINLEIFRLSESCIQIPSGTARKTTQVQGGPAGTRYVDFRATSNNRAITSEHHVGCNVIPAWGVVKKKTLFSTNSSTVMQHSCAGSTTRGGPGARPLRLGGSAPLPLPNHSCPFCPGRSTQPLGKTESASKAEGSWFIWTPQVPDWPFLMQIRAPKHHSLTG